MNMKPAKTLKNFLLANGEYENLKYFIEALEKPELEGWYVMPNKQQLFDALCLVHGVADRLRAPDIVYRSIRALQAGCWPTDRNGIKIGFDYKR